MPRLRMKPSTLSSTEEAVLRATRRASRKSKHKRRASESISPPRHPPAPPPQPPPDDFDESSVPPSQAYKQTRAEEEDEDEAEFEYKLRDAANADQGIGFYEYHHLAYSTSYGSAAGNAAGVRGPAATAGMDEEEYAEYIRAGMWRLQNKERLEWMEKQEKLRREQEERDRVQQIERERKEAQRRRKLEQRKRDESKLEQARARERYEVGWKKLHALGGGGGGTAMGGSEGDAKARSLRFTDFVWPLFPPFALPPISWPTPNEITSTSIEEFLLPEEVQGEARKAKLRAAVLSYHPDRFERFVAKVGTDDDSDDDGVRDRVRELGLRVSQVLNDLLKELGSKK
ncbi:hypothetical protein JCM11491_006732 [Sporobolomyces phaffii]